MSRRMVALARMRLARFLRAGRALAPLLGVLLAVGIMYGGGRAQAGEAYGFSAAVLFPLLAWQTQILLDVEPDVQRRLSIVAVGGMRREIAAGLLAAAVSGIALIAIALAAPWGLGGITGPQRPEDPTLLAGVTAGVWAHLLLLPPALALGALATRAAVGNAARGVAVLVGGAVLAFVLGTRSSPAPWLVPPALPAARSTVEGLAPGALTVHTGQALVWAAAVVAGYVLLRRRNN